MSSDWQRTNGIVSLLVLPFAVLAAVADLADNPPSLKTLTGSREGKEQDSLEKSS
jgi:hypothetical protein